MKKSIIVLMLSLISFVAIGIALDHYQVIGSVSFGLGLIAACLNISVYKRIGK